MKRYNMDHIDGLFIEPEGEWVKHSEAEGLINKLKQQNKEMLDYLRKARNNYYSIKDDYALDSLIEKIEQEK